MLEIVSSQSYGTAHNQWNSRKLWRVNCTAHSH